MRGTVASRLLARTIPDRSDRDADEPQVDAAWWVPVPGISARTRGEFQDLIVALTLYSRTPTPESRMMFGLMAERLLLAIPYCRLPQHGDREAKAIEDRICGSSFHPSVVEITAPAR